MLSGTPASANTNTFSQSVKLSFHLQALLGISLRPTVYRKIPVLTLTQSERVLSPKPLIPQQTIHLALAAAMSALRSSYTVHTCETFPALLVYISEIAPFLQQDEIIKIFFLPGR
jgi:hypothetical protein